MNHNGLHVQIQLFQKLDDIIILLASIGLCLLTLVIFKRFLSHENVRGSPRYTWYHGVIMQIGVLQYLGLYAWLKKPEYINTTEEWLFTPWSDSLEKGFDRHVEVVWFCAFLAYMIKDFFFAMDTEFVLHHILCVALAINFLMIESTPAIFMLGSCTMEVGSCSQSLFYLYPRSMFFKTVHFLGMTVSNSVSSWLILVFLKNSTHLSTLATVLLTLAVGGLALGRQVLCFVNVGLSPFQPPLALHESTKKSR